MGETAWTEDTVLRINKEMAAGASANNSSNTTVT